MKDSDNKSKEKVFEGEQTESRSGKVLTSKKKNKIEDIFNFDNCYAEISLGNFSLQRLLERVLNNSGYTYNGPREMEGLSGLKHPIDAIGFRGDNLSLVLCGPKNVGLVLEKDHSALSPKMKYELWCRDALFSMYDISALLERQNVKIDLVLFENVRKKELPMFLDLAEWQNKYLLPKDINGSWQSSVIGIERPGDRFLCDSSQSIGACYFGLDDLTLEEISAICGNDNKMASEKTKEAMTRIRVDQYFNPPTDELIMSALSIAQAKSNAFIKDIYDAAVHYHHRPVTNVIVPGTDYTDPIATAKELAKYGMLEYEAEVHLTDNSKEYTHKIKKTAQENFVIKLLKTIDVPGAVKSIIQGIKG